MPFLIERSKHRFFHNIKWIFIPYFVLFFIVEGIWAITKPKVTSPEVLADELIIAYSVAGVCFWICMAIFLINLIGFIVKFKKKDKWYYFFRDNFLFSIVALIATFVFCFGFVYIQLLGQGSVVG